MHDELRAICDRHGIFLRWEALALGYSDRSLARARRAKVIHRVRHGSYVFVDQWVTLTDTERHLLTARAVLRTAQTPLALSHTTALILMGAPVWDLPLGEVHVTRLDHRAGRREAGVVQHRGLLLPGDLVQIDGVVVTSPTRAALDITTITNVEHSLPVLDHLLRANLTSKSLLREGARAMSCWSGTLTTDLCIALADGRSESVAESRSRHMLWLGGLPMPEPQYEILDINGNVVARVDFAWPELGVFLEFDGKEKYLRFRREGESVPDAVLREKKREEMICRLTGWRCIRIVWADLYRWQQTCAYIRSVLAGGPVHR